MPTISMFFLTIFTDTLVPLMQGLFPIAGLEYEMEQLMHTITGITGIVKSWLNNLLCV